MSLPLTQFQRNYSDLKPMPAKLSTLVGEVALKMSRDLESFFMNQPVKEIPNEGSIRPKVLSKSPDQDKAITAFDEWHFVLENTDIEEDDWELPSKEYEDTHHDALFSHKGSGTPLKLAGLTGPVLGLAFNNEYANMLAAASRGDKLNIYQIDCPVRDSTSTYEFADGLEKVKNA